MRALFDDYVFAILLLACALAAIIIFLPLYRDWESRQKAKILAKKLELQKLQKKVCSFQERRRKASSPEIELSTAN